MSQFMTRTLDYRREEEMRAAKGRRFAIMLTLVVGSGLIGCYAGDYMAQQKPAFDYERCDWIVAKGHLDAAPSIPDWKDMTTTPGGNWCITTRK